LNRIVAGVLGLTAALVLAGAGLATATTTLGSISIPGDATGNRCQPGYVLAQAHSDPSTPFTVPGPGTITQWQVNSINAGAGAPVTFVVLRPATLSMSVVGVDARTLPDPLPPGDNAVSYTPATPIPVAGGETLGLYTSDTSFYCQWHGVNTIPAANDLVGLTAPVPPATGQNLAVFRTSDASYRMNLAATFTPPAKKKCRKHKKKHKRFAEAAKKKCKKKKKR
jgi:hypothetical protein